MEIETGFRWVNPVKRFVIGLFQHFRMWTADRFEKLVRARLRQDRSSEMLMGAGIHYTISETEKFIGRTSSIPSFM